MQNQTKSEMSNLYIKYVIASKNFLLFIFSTIDDTRSLQFLKSWDYQIYAFVYTYFLENKAVKYVNKYFLIVISLFMTKKYKESFNKDARFLM